MGSARWDAGAWTDYASTTYTPDKTVRDVFKSSSLVPDLDIKGKIRESRDSAVNPLSTPVIVALDVTGSMGSLALALAQKMGTVMEGLLNRKPITDPHMLAMGIGDVVCDRVPVQATQFEADLRINEQIEKLYLEGGGGGNHSESYDAAWYFAANHTITDSWEKRGKRGYLFTVGDEEAPYGLKASHIRNYFGGQPTEDYSPEQLLAMAERCWNVYHVVVEQGSHAQHSLPKVMETWNGLIGQRVLRLSDYNNLAEVIVSAIQVAEGADRDAVTSSWTGPTSAVVGRAIATVPTSIGSSGGLVRF